MRKYEFGAFSHIFFDTLRAIRQFVFRQPNGEISVYVIDEIENRDRGRNQWLSAD